MHASAVPFINTCMNSSREMSPSPSRSSFSLSIFTWYTRLTYLSNARAHVADTRQQAHGDGVALVVCFRFVCLGWTRVRGLVALFHALDRSGIRDIGSHVDVKLFELVHELLLPLHLIQAMQQPSVSPAIYTTIVRA